MSKWRMSRKSIWNTDDFLGQTILWKGDTGRRSPFYLCLIKCFLDNVLKFDEIELERFDMLAKFTRDFLIFLRFLHITCPIFRIVRWSIMHGRYHHRAISSNLKFRKFIDLGEACLAQDSNVKVDAFVLNTISVFLICCWQYIWKYHNNL